MSKTSTIAILDPVVQEAIDRCEIAESWEAHARKGFDYDLAFANADSENLDQWDKGMASERSGVDRPVLTVNKVRQHNLAIVNDARENKPAMKVMPTGNEATYESAQAWSAILRRIEYQSQAGDIYSTATRFMVDAGIGYVRVLTKYVDDKTFDQDIFIDLVPNPKLVYVDPDARKPGKPDMNWALIFEDLTEDGFRKKYPKYSDKVSSTDITFGTTSWLSQKNIRVAEYYRRVMEEFKLYATLYDHDNPLKMSDEYRYYTEKEIAALPEPWRKGMLKHPSTKSRNAQKIKVEWKLIIGHQVVEEAIWPGEEIPIVPFCAEEIVINGKMDRISHTRSMRDPQRIYNYWTSASVEYGALQTKTPWITPIEAIEGFTDYWEHANTENAAYLPYNAWDDNGQQIPAPARVQPPVSSPLALEGLKVSSMELEMVSGQYAPSMGQPGNERTGKAINERQRMGDRATYHYIDAVGTAVARIGRICLDIVPKVYDTKRALMVFAEDGTTLSLQVDPQAQQAYAETQQQNMETVQRIFNPSIGKYDVMADVGPGYATRREEAFNAFTLLLTQNPQLTAVIGDLMLKAGDFPLSDEAAIRLKRMIPPQALGKGPSAQEQQLMQENGQLKQLLQKITDQYAQERLRSNSRAELRDVDAYNAITQRLKVMGGQLQDAHTVALTKSQLDREVSQENLQPVRQKAEDDLDVNPTPRPDVNEQYGLPFDREAPPVPGARKAPDGHYYIQDPARPGKHYVRVIPKGPGQ